VGGRRSASAEEKRSSREHALPKGAAAADRARPSPGHRERGIDVKKFFNWVLVAAACVGAFYGIGLIVPRSQTLASKTTFVADPDKLYAVVADVASWPQWHPDVRAAEERATRKDNPVWKITEKGGTSYELEVQNDEAPSLWQATYTIDGARYTLRFEAWWFGQGSRGRVTRTIDTRDPWRRAKGFLLARDEAKPAGLLNALGAHFGETVTIKDD
jgi:hypothetical protein